MTELRGSVPTRVPTPRVVPTAPPRVASVGSRVPVARVVETPIPAAVILPTRVPGPTVVPTKLPPWVRKIMVAIAAEAEIRVQVVGVEMDGTEALRGQGAITVEPVSIETGTTPKEIGGRGRIEALVGMVLDAGVRELAARGAVSVVSAVMALPAGLREIRAQGLVQAVRTGYQLAPAGQSIRGRGAITVSGVSQALNFVRQRMVKSGTWSVTDNSTVQVTGWASDGTYPANVVSNGLVVTGAGQATISWNLTVNSGNASNWKIRLNGSEVGSNTSGSTTRTLAEGDRIEVWRSSVGFLTHSVTGGYVEVIPT